MSTDRGQVEQLCAAAFGQDAVAITDLKDVGQGRGAFSKVLRASLAWNSQQGLTQAPGTVVAKLPADGANGEAARTAGAYRREALAYREILIDAPIATPEAYAIEETDDGSCALLLEDLTPHRSVDQLDGLGVEDACSVAESLAVFHRSWREQETRRNDLPVRRNTVAGLSDKGLASGVETLSTTWVDLLDDDQRDAYRTLVAVRPTLAERFDEATDTLCHGDPRADNLVFGPDGVILFDWQQMALQFGEADLAWLAATSLHPEQRRAVDNKLVEVYGGSFDRYRLGLALPGLAVLFLAQRELSTERTRQFVALSLQRIAAAITDLEVAAIGR